MDSIILSYLVWWAPIGYLLIFLGMLFEGDTVVFISAFLTSQEFLEFKYIIPTLGGGVLIGDLCWYWLGKRFANSKSRPMRWILDLGKPFDNHLLESPLRTIFISKFTYGLHHPILMRAGALGVPVKRFIKNDLISSALWILAVGFLGYISGASFQLVKKYLKYAEVALIISLAIFFLIAHIVARRSKREL